MQSCLSYVPKLHLCQMGMKDLRTKLGYQLAVLCRETVYLRKKNIS